MNAETALIRLQQLLDGAVKGGLIGKAADVVNLQQCIDCLRAELKKPPPENT